MSFFLSAAVAPHFFEGLGACGWPEGNDLKVYNGLQLTLLVELSLHPCASYQCNKRLTTLFGLYRALTSSAGVS